MNRTRLLQIGSVVVFLALIAWMTAAGIRLRRWTWDHTTTIRYVPDMQNAWNWGSRAARDGYFTLYDRVIAESPDKQYGLDYVPLRLGVMMLWARWAYGTFPGINGWGPEYALNAPLLHLNAAMEFAAAVGMFFLVRQWIRKERQPRPRSSFKWSRWTRLIRKRSRDAATEVADVFPDSGEHVSHELPASIENPSATSVAAFKPASTSTAEKNDPASSERPIRFFEGNWIALLAAALVWFNFSSIFSAFARPTWDVWVIPFYIWAVFFAGRNNWFIAGAIVGVGAMLKGQQLVIAPFFLLWPLFSLRFGAMARWVIGLALAAGLIVAPWQVWLTPKRGPLLLCIAGVLVGPAVWAIVHAVPHLWQRIQSRRGADAENENVVDRPSFEPLEGGCPQPPTGQPTQETADEDSRPPSAISLASAALLRFVSLRLAIWISAFCLVAALWLSPLLFSTSTGWLKIGFIYGVDKMPNLETGSPASFAAILQHRFDWNSDDVVALPFTKWTPTMKTLLAVIGYALIAVSAAAAAWHARNHDRRFLLAVAAPWLVYFTIFPEMHERYLLWASLMTAAAVAVNVGLTGLHLLLTAFSWTMAMDQLLRDGKPRGFATGISRTFGRKLMHFTHTTVPDSGWAILVICVIWLWMMFATPKRRRQPKPVHLANKFVV